MKEYPETHQTGFISIKNIPDKKSIIGDLGIQIAKNSRVWIYIDGIALLRFMPNKNKGEVNQMFTLDIGIVVKKSLEDTFNICDEIENSLNKDRNSSGYGFGIRDMQFEFNTEKEAKISEEKVKEIFKKHNLTISDNESYLSVYNNEENN